MIRLLANRILHLWYLEALRLESGGEERPPRRRPEARATRERWKKRQDGIHIQIWIPDMDHVHNILDMLQIFPRVVDISNWDMVGHSIGLFHHEVDFLARDNAPGREISIRIV